MKRAVLLGLLLVIVSGGCAARSAVAAGRADSVSEAGTGGGSQCSELPGGWTATWVDGVAHGAQAFAIAVDDGRLEVRGQACGPKATWKAERVCWSAAGRTLWLFWTSAPTAEVAWTLPYAPEQVGVLGECVARRDVWLPVVFGPGHGR